MALASFVCENKCGETISKKAQFCQGCCKEHSFKFNRYNYAGTINGNIVLKEMMCYKCGHIMWERIELDDELYYLMEQIGEITEFQK